MSRGRFALACAAALIAVASPAHANQDEATAAEVTSAEVSLPIGTQIPLVLTQELSSRRQSKGDLVTLEVAEDVHGGDIVVIPAGTPVVAQITVAEKKGAMGRGGKLQLKPLYLEMPHGPVRLSGRLGTDGKDNTGAATAATALITGFAFAITGKSAVIPEGTEMVAVLDRSIRLPASEKPVQAASLSASNP